MRSPPTHTEIAIVGGGPVGLYLGAALARDGADVVVLEARHAPSSHSRAIGVHPPGLAALAEVGAADPLIARGVAVRRGVAYGGGTGSDPRRLGELAFDRVLPEPYPFVLTVPQPVTEEVLAARLEAYAPGSLRRRVRVTGIDAGADAVRLRLELPGRGEAGRLRARLCVFCGGTSGDADRLLNVPASGERYPDTYLMGDAPDGTGLGADAAIHVHPAGVVESFPLPGGLRRWVVRTPNYQRGAAPADLAGVVRARTGAVVDPAAIRGLSAFGVQRRLAARAATGRVWLAGDAAHVVSPIGGQGMNLGWLGARAAARALARVRAGEAGLEEAAAAYDAEVRTRARAAAARAEWNMRAGRPSAFPAPREVVLRALLSPPLASRLARRFTMQD